MKIREISLVRTKANLIRIYTEGGTIDIYPHLRGGDDNRPRIRVNVAPESDEWTHGEKNWQWVQGNTPELKDGICGWFEDLAGPE